MSNQRIRLVIGSDASGFTGFDNLRQLVSFAGYDVVENQSGKRVGKTKISKKATAELDESYTYPLSIAAAHRAVRFGEPSCQALFERVWGRTQIKMKGYVAVQKKLLTLCYALWENDTAYDATY